MINSFLRLFVFITTLNFLFNSNVLSSSDFGLTSGDQMVSSYTIAAKQGNVEAMMQMGNYYSRPELVGNKGSIRKAIKWYKKAAMAGNTESMEILGFIYLSDKNPEKNEKESFRWFKQAASKGMGFSQLQLSKMYNSGTGVKKNETLSKHWLKKAEELGYKEHTSTPNENEIPLSDQAIRIAIKSASQGSTEAMMTLAMHYSLIDNINATNAIKWYKKAANAGSTRAMLMLGATYYNGLNEIKKNPGMAFHWINKAANKGQVQAQRLLADMYAKGVGVNRDREKSAYWLNRANQQKSM